MRNDFAFDLEPFIRQAMERMHVEIEERSAHLVAAKLRELGWQCYPPPETSHVCLTPTPYPTAYHITWRCDQCGKLWTLQQRNPEPDWYWEALP